MTLCSSTIFVFFPLLTKIGHHFMFCLTLHFPVLVLQEVASECQNMNWGTFKPILTDALIDHLHPIQVYIISLSYIDFEFIFYQFPFL